MAVYETIKDVLTLAQKADNIELVQKVMDIQKDSLDMQHKMQMKDEEILTLKKKIEELSERKKYTYEVGHKWYIDPSNPEIKLCATCLNRDNFESPLASPGHEGHRYCGNCKNNVN